MPKMVTGNGQKGWPHIQRLLVDLFQFMEPFLRHAELGDPVRLSFPQLFAPNLVCLFAPSAHFCLILSWCYN